jgi:hypothetical protein
MTTDLRRLIMGITAILVVLFAAPSHAQNFGHPLVAYARFSMRDVAGNLVIDPHTGKPFWGGWCVAWPSNGANMWLTASLAPDEDPTQDWVTGTRYYVNVEQRTVTFSEVRFWKVTRGAPSDPAGAGALVGSGWKLVSPYGVPDYITFRINVVVKLYDQPQPEWSQYEHCGWQKMVAAFEWHPAPGGGGGGTYALPYWLTHPSYCKQGSTTI